MTIHNETVTVNLPVRDEGPLTPAEVVGQVALVVSAAVQEWYETQSDQTLAYEPDIDVSAA